MKYLRLFEDFEDFEDYNPYDLMVMFPDERFKMLIEEIKKWEPNLNLVSDLIALGTNLDGIAPYTDDFTASHLAVRRNHSEILQMLIGAGADLNVQDKHSRTVLNLAMSEGRTEMAKMILNSGKAGVNIPDCRGRTPLHWAVRGAGNWKWPWGEELVQMLIGAGAKLDIQDKDGSTALHLAARENQPNIAQMLVDAGARKDIQNKWGEIPFRLSRSAWMQRILSGK